ncbi:polyphenol oxidase family protein [Desulfovibrio mangrovi]|uniref:polyphenol oxidase family protein n=1 Tax=Desulfovibrio mangrovi TaxID=2976983 RepID=UPI002247C95B|nr:polyphenol oxidase family protein [Desulfovibrio mangrovi]UZP66439.1 polyphenol oxidase family protein [Desulfovibrio mangrovi]
MAVDFIPFRFPGIASVRCSFQTRRGGVSEATFGGSNISHDVGDNAEHVTENRRQFMQGLGIETWCELRQVHGDALIFDPPHVAPDTAGSIEADGSATDIAGRALVIKTADCQPILLAHSSGKYVAALHAGWRGNRIGYPQTAVKAFCERYDLKPQDIMAVRGPSLGPAMAEFVNFDMEWGSDWTRWYDAATKTMNLWQLTRDQLQEAGIPAGSIFGLDLCTHTHEDLFFSYRRSKVEGRQASLIWIQPE